MMTKEFNRMCLDCPHLETHCSGTHSDIYSGCVWKKAKSETLDAYIAHVTFQETGGDKKKCV